MIQRVVTGSNWLRHQVPIGTPTRAPAAMTAVALRSAFRHAFGSNGAAAMKSITSSSAATRRGDAMLLANGMKISAEPKPENPRAVPETKAITQIAIAAARLTSGGIRPERLIPVTSGRDPGSALRRPQSCPQAAAGLLGDFSDDLGADRIDFLIGQGLFAGLDRHRNRDRLLAIVDALAFIDVEHGDAGDQLLVDALRPAHDIARAH